MQSITFEQLPHIVGLLHEKLDRIEKLLSAPVTQLEADVLLTIQQAAEFLHLSVATLYGKVHARTIPFSKQGKRLYFSKAELIEWIKSGRRKTQSEVSAEAHVLSACKKK